MAFIVHSFSIALAHDSICEHKLSRKKYAPPLRHHRSNDTRRTRVSAQWVFDGPIPLAKLFRTAQRLSRLRQPYSFVSQFHNGYSRFWLPPYFAARLMAANYVVFTVAVQVVVWWHFKRVPLTAQPDGVGTALIPAP
ncbi:hypothetical protein [Vreelandella alkaliphila]|uniref:Uncharacterized protein n=1 Tax=Vreelandella alkaliphila TaxID=272774 RepID=A0AAJ2VSM7_9GAMM|nr:hypothetical protein [Halomonas alkaliphila]MDX5979575.1 hypothetical protein [Halomonas alkaliphila]